MNSHEYKIIGMDCAEEVALIKRALAGIVEENALRFDLLQGKLTVISERSEGELRTAIGTSGMKALLWREHLRQQDLPTSFLHRNIREILCAASGLSIVIGFAIFLYSAGLQVLLHPEDAASAIYPPASVACFLFATLSGGFFVAPKAWYALRGLRADMNLLMCIAVVGAFILGEFMEAASVAFLFSTALLLESWSVGRARRAVESLLDLSPKTARFICPHDGDIMEKPIAEVPLGVTVLLRPGERVPLDGEVTKGTTTVNQAPITGESMPIEKGIGDFLFAGSVNVDGSVEFKVTRAANDTQLAHIIHLVKETQGERAHTEQWVEKFAQVYTPVMLVIALIVALALPLLTGMDWADSVYQALVILLIACPCALVISTPVSIVSALARAARNGVLIKGGACLEMPAHIDTIALDKTGTLTEGKPSVSEVLPLNQHTTAELLAIASGIEAHSAHPLALAICAYAAVQEITPQIAVDFQDKPGRGAEAVINGEPYWVGNLRHLQEKGHQIKADTESQHSGESFVYIGNAAHVCGKICLRDTVRENSREACTEFHLAGIKSIVLLSGDHETAVRKVAEELGIDHFEFGLMPEEKVNAIKAIQAQGKKVAMVGDGVNDAPAMAAADLSIAMGAAGTDTAIETADIALMTDDLRKIAWLIGHSRRTLRIIKQNTALALGLKLIILVLAVMGYGALWLAIAADMGASLLVTFNALRLLRD